jgi:hypothetical protein
MFIRGIIYIKIRNYNTKMNRILNFFCEYMRKIHPGMKNISTRVAISGIYTNETIVYRKKFNFFLLSMMKQNPNKGNVNNVS